MRYKIEMWYERKAGEHVYDVDLDLSEEGLEDCLEQVLELQFKNVMLELAGERLHHLIRLVEGRGEISVDLIQKQKRMPLTPANINHIRESLDSAREFFAPTIIERKTNAPST
jgi:hypothetical protein